ncbi:MAG: hypothetical protein WAT39_13550 [Planctomycetota bacterium]
MKARSLFPVLAIAGVAAAQTPPCISLNDATTTVGTSTTAFGFSGPGVRAWQFIPSVPLVLQAAEIFTSSLAATTPRGYQTLEIWDSNLIFLPGTRLAGGTWQNQPNLGLAWQGASFDQVAVLNASQTYWLVWRESGGNRLPYEPGGTLAVAATFSGGTWVLQAAGQAIKWRGYCSLLDDLGVAPVGSGCLSSANRIPAEFTNNAPTIGNADFQLEGTGFPPGSIGLAALGVNPAWISIPIPGTPPGCLLHTDPLVTVTVFVGTGNEQALHSVGASGHVFLDSPVPANPGLVGVQIISQFAVLDLPQPVPLPFVLSNGLRVTLY